MNIELDEDVFDNIVLKSLTNSHKNMVEQLERYKQPNPGFVAIFDVNPEEDIRQLKKMRDALALVINHWYGGSVMETSSGEADVSLIRENEDGSADYSFHFPPEAMQALTRLGILTAIQAGIEDAKRLDPEEPSNFATYDKYGKVPPETLPPNPYNRDVNGVQQEFLEENT